MSEIQHPPIDLRLSSAPSLERVFAEEAYQMLTTFAVEGVATLDNIHITYPVTDRYDIVTEDEEDEGNHALRLKGVPVMTPSWAGYTPSLDKYYVMELQRGELLEECDMPTDEEFTWFSYVMAVIDKEDVDSVSILDAKTGRDLYQHDLGYALMILQVMRQEMRSMKFEEEIIAPDVEPEFMAVLERGSRNGEKKMYALFDSEEPLEISACKECSSVNASCSHVYDPERLN